MRKFQIPNCRRKSNWLPSFVISFARCDNLPRGSRTSSCFRVVLSGTTSNLNEFKFVYPPVMRATTFPLVQSLGGPHRTTRLHPVSASSACATLSQLAPAGSLTPRPGCITQHSSKQRTNERTVAVPYEEQHSSRNQPQPKPKPQPQPQPRRQNSNSNSNSNSNDNDNNDNDNERTDERTDERTNERTNKRTNKRTNNEQI